MGVSIHKGHGKAYIGHGMVLIRQNPGPQCLITMDEKDTQNVPNKNLSSRDTSFAFIQAKAERLATAVYLVSQFISDELLRTKIRRCALELISSVNTNNVHNVHSVLLGIVHETTGLLNVAYRAGYVSEMNWSLLSKEYMEFTDILNERGDVIAGHGMTLSKNLFDTGSRERLLRTPKEKERESISKPPVKDKRTFDRGQDQAHVATPKSTVVSERKDERRTIILDLLKRQKQVTVRDVAVAIPGVSEKTLQRELVRLVDEGVLKREGERRWSTYSLI